MPDGYQLSNRIRPEELLTLAQSHVVAAYGCMGYPEPPQRLIEPDIAPVAIRFLQAAKSLTSNARNEIIELASAEENGASIAGMIGYYANPRNENRYIALSNIKSMGHEVSGATLQEIGKSPTASAEFVYAVRDLLEVGLAKEEVVKLGNFAEKNQCDRNGLITAFTIISPGRLYIG